MGRFKPSKKQQEKKSGSKPRKSSRPSQAPPPRRQAKQTDEARAPGGKRVEGIIHHHRDGFAFVKPIVGEVSEDLFIPPDEARKALDNDQVLIEVGPGRGGRTMGRVVEVTSRTRQQIIGTYHEDGRKAWVEPREQELGRVRVPMTQLARSGDVVKVRLGVGDSMFQSAQALTGEVAGSLGAEADHSIEVLSVAFSKGFHDEFPPEVMDEADRVPLEVSEKEARGEGRRDLRRLPLITIDGEDARDFDDAVYAEAHRDGTRLVVAIADVSHYVREGTGLDAEALRRATSVYLPGRVLPMLPERLSNGICSLRPEVDRLCMVADMVIDRQGETLSTEVYPGVMRSAARCTYTEVHEVLAGKAVPGRVEFKAQFARLLSLSKTLHTMRVARGAVDFDLPEQRVELGDDGLPVRLVRRERWESHRLIEECMLAANEAVARFFRERELPTVNRFHGPPDEVRLETFVTLLGAYGIQVPKGELTSKVLNQVLKKLDGHPEQRALNQLALRSMAQAVYSSREAGHYGLGAEDYLHFTSPIRRYPDLLVHRELKALWSRRQKRLSSGQQEAEEERLEAKAVQSSERERAAMQVEREVNQLYACLLLKDRVGEEHDGTVSSLTDHGFFVQLDELLVEGFVKGESVSPDFDFDQSTYRMRFGGGLTVKVGMPCRVRILSVNLARKQIDYQAVAIEGAVVQEPRRWRSQDSRQDRKRQAPGREQRSGGRPQAPTRRPESRDRREAPPRGQARRMEPRRQSERAPPPKQPWEQEKVAKEETSETRSGQFDARSVLDRLWRERGGKGKKR